MFRRGVASRASFACALLVLAAPVPSIAQGVPGGGDSTAAKGSLSGRTLFTGAVLSRLPIDDARQALALVPGVVSRGTGIGIANAPSLTIRGSLADQTAVTIDGAPARFELFGAQGPVLGLGGIAALSVEAGVAPADVADARGAAIAYVTRSGGSRLEGSFTAGGEQPFGFGSTVGYSRFEGTLGGPVRWVPRLTFFLAGSLQGQPSAYRGSGADGVPTYQLAGVDTVFPYQTQSGDTAMAVLPRFAQVSGRCGTTGNSNTAVGRDIQSNYGYDCQGLRRPLDWSTSRRGLAKLHYAYGTGSSLSFTGVASDLQRRFSPGGDIGAPGLYQGERTHSWLAVVDWTHVLGLAGRGGVIVRANASWGWDEDVSGPLTITSSAATASPALGIEFGTLRFAGLDALSFPDLGGIIHNLRTFGGPVVPFPGRTDLGPYQPFRFNPYGVWSGWPTEGMDGQLILGQEHRLNARLAAEWEVRQGLHLAAGGDLSRTDVAFYQGDFFTAFDVDAFVAHPRRTGLFASARLERAGVSVEAGLRADRFDAGAEFPNVPGRIITNPAAAVPPGGDTTYAAFVARVFTRSRPQTLLSPRIRLAFRIGSRTVGRLGYGEHVAPPRLRDQYAFTNTDAISLGSYPAFGQDVRLVKTGILEAGVRHGFRPDLAFDLSVYRKTGVTPYFYRLQPVYDPFYNRMITVGLLSPMNDRVMGADARLEWRAGAALSGSLAYSFERTHLASDSTLYFGPDQSTHAIGASAALEVPDGWHAGSWLGAALRGVRADVTARATSGLPYTPALINSGSGIFTPDIGLYSGALGSAHLPWTYLVDLRVAKAIEAAGVHGTLYLEVRNLLNTVNLIGAFAETGADANDAFRSRFESSGLGSLQSEPPASALATDGSIDLTQSCSAWRYAANCVALQRVENRFGDGDGHYTPAEQRRALDAYYDTVYGSWRFHGPARTARVGLELRF